MTNAARMKALFSGLERAYGTYKVTGVRDGKQVGEALTLVEPVTEALWQGHLDGKRSLGIVPIRDDSSALFGAIDIDQYEGIDMRKIISSIRALKYPLCPCRSKSGGLHLYLFCERPVAAGDLRDRLSAMAASLGFGGCEVFPKQSRILASRGDIGQWINMPYFDAADTKRPGLDDQAQPLTVEAFLALAEASRCDALKVELDEAVSSGDLADGPPCLGYIIGRGVEQGMRNDILFNLGVYLKQAVPKAWRELLEEKNERYFKPPLDLQELRGLVRGGRREYMYTCSKPPLKTYCDKGACRLRKFGVGHGGDFPLLAGLTKFDTQPPTWFVDIDGGGRVELNTDDLQQQARFQKRCMECLNLMPPAIKPEQWRTVVQTLMDKLVVIQAPSDASAVGQLFDLLEAFCTGRAQAKVKEELLIGKPWVNEGRHYFRMADFMAYLDRQRFREFKVHQVARTLRDRGATNLFMKLNRKGVNLWSVPEFEREERVDLPLPDLGEGTPI